jgi:hypothetical protein
MTSAAAVVFVAGLTAISFWFLIALWFFDKWHARTLEDRKLQRAVHSVQAARASMPEPAQRVEFDNDESFWDSLGVDPLAADLADQNGHVE